MDYEVMRHVFAEQHSHKSFANPASCLFLLPRGSLSCPVLLQGIGGASLIYRDNCANAHCAETFKLTVGNLPNHSCRYVENAQLEGDFFMERDAILARQQEVEVRAGFVQSRGHGRR
jgi:hypothetical protein